MTFIKNTKDYNENKQRSPLDVEEQKKIEHLRKPIQTRKRQQKERKGDGDMPKKVRKCRQHLGRHTQIN